MALTPAEEALWQKLRRHQVCGLRFQRQLVVGPFIADFYCRAVRLIVEVDGEVHSGMEVRDAERDALLTAQGFRVIRFKNAEVLANVDGVVGVIRAAVAEHPAQPHP